MDDFSFASGGSGAGPLSYFFRPDAASAASRAEFERLLSDAPVYASRRIRGPLLDCTDSAANRAEVSPAMCIRHEDLLRVWRDRCLRFARFRDSSRYDRVKAGLSEPPSCSSLDLRAASIQCDMLLTELSASGLSFDRLPPLLYRCGVVQDRPATEVRSRPSVVSWVPCDPAEYRRVAGIPEPTPRDFSEAQQTLVDALTSAKGSVRRSNMFHALVSSKVFAELGWWPFWVTLTCDQASDIYLDNPRAASTAALNLFRDRLVDDVLRKVPDIPSDWRTWLAYCFATEGGKSGNHLHFHGVMWLKYCPKILRDFGAGGPQLCYFHGLPGWKAFASPAPEALDRDFDVRDFLEGKSGRTRYRDNPVGFNKVFPFRFAGDRFSIESYDWPIEPATGAMAGLADKLRSMRGSVKAGEASDPMVASKISQIARTASDWQRATISPFERPAMYIAKYVSEDFYGAFGESVKGMPRRKESSGFAFWLLDASLREASLDDLFTLSMRPASEHVLRLCTLYLSSWSASVVRYRALHEIRRRTRRDPSILDDVRVHDLVFEARHSPFPTALDRVDKIEAKRREAGIDGAIGSMSSDTTLGDKRRPEVFNFWHLSGQQRYSARLDLFGLPVVDDAVYLRAFAGVVVDAFLPQDGAPVWSGVDLSALVDPVERTRRRLGYARASGFTAPSDLPRGVVDRLKWAADDDKIVDEDEVPDRLRSFSGANQ